MFIYIHRHMNAYRYPLLILWIICQKESLIRLSDNPVTIVIYAVSLLLQEGLSCHLGNS